MKNKRSHHNHSFSEIPGMYKQRSIFNRSHTHKTTFKAGELVPHYVDEILPGDSFRLQHSMFLRSILPLQVPVMDNLYMDTFYFFVPMRLIWENWQKQQGEQENPGDSTDYLTPVIDFATHTSHIETGSIGDYFGMPVGTTRGSSERTSIYHRGYMLIWNEWFRDQNLQDSYDIPKGDGPDVYGGPDPDIIRGPLRRGKRHDYFTSCLPWPQKGPGVEIPLGTSAPVIGDGNTLGMWQGNPAAGYGAYINATNQMTAAGGSYGLTAGAPASTTVPANNNLTIGVTTNPQYSGLIADLSTATAATINSLRQAFQIQKVYERDARGGTRYTEILRSHFGVISPDARLMRPEYLGGSSTRLDIIPVTQTSESGTTPQANMSAHLIGAKQSNGFNKSFVEHGLVIGICNIRADLTYQYGLHKMFSRRERFDYYLPTLAHLGEQAVLNKEIYVQGTSADDDVFGYQERWSEYRYGNNKITGHLKADAALPLNEWHLAEEWITAPSLNDTFIQDPTTETFDRVSAVQNEEQFVMDCYFDLKCARPLPVYSVPGLIDHF